MLFGVITVKETPKRVSYVRLCPTKNTNINRILEHTKVKSRDDGIRIYMECLATDKKKQIQTD